MDKMKIGIIGCGGIATGKHLSGLKSITDVEIAAFCDINESRAVKAKEEFGTAESKVYTDYKDVISRADITAVYVLTSNRMHSIISVDAMRAGKHVMCEKPMAKTSSEAKAMVETARETQKILTIGYQNRYRADSMFCKRLCEDGELGEIYYAKAYAIRRRAVPTRGVFLNEYEQGGGPLIDIGTHALDLTLWLMNNYEPESVMGSVYKKLYNQTNTGNAWGDWDIKKFNVEDSAFGFIKMKNGATILLESSWALNTLDIKEAKTTLCGTKAGLDMDDGVRINSIVNNRQCVLKPDFESNGVDFYTGNSQSPSELEQRIFIDAITKGTELIVRPEQAYVVTQILEAIYESSKTGKPINF